MTATPRPVLVLALVGAAGLVAGALVGFGVAQLTESGSNQSPGVIAEGALERLPPGRVQVRAERVSLPAGFESRHFHGGPTFNFVDAGAVRIDSGGRRAQYQSGDFFFEPARRVHTITVLDDARLRVVRLLLPGVEATTEAP
jgi:quercetin dioxygenase-like cupin family protein